MKIKVFPPWPRSLAGKLVVLFALQFGGCWLGGMYMPFPQPPVTYYVMCTYREMDGSSEEKAYSTADQAAAHALAKRETRLRHSDSSFVAVCSVIPSSLVEGVK